jgi:hypothetical protein
MAPERRGSFTTFSPLHHSIFTRLAQLRASLLHRWTNEAITPG